MIHLKATLLNCCYDATSIPLYVIEENDIGNIQNLISDCENKIVWDAYNLYLAENEKK